MSCLTKVLYGLNSEPTHSTLTTGDADYVMFHCASIKGNSMKSAMQATLSYVAMETTDMAQLSHHLIKIYSS